MRGGWAAKPSALSSVSHREQQCWGAAPVPRIQRGTGAGRAAPGAAGPGVDASPWGHSETVRFGLHRPFRLCRPSSTALPGGEIRLLVPKPCLAPPAGTRTRTRGQCGAPAALPLLPVVPCPRAWRRKAEPYPHSHFLCGFLVPGPGEQPSLNLKGPPLRALRQGPRSYRLAVWALENKRSRSAHVDGAPHCGAWWLTPCCARCILG